MNPIPLHPEACELARYGGDRDWDSQSAVYSREDTNRESAQKKGSSLVKRAEQTKKDHRMVVYGEESEGEIQIL